MAFVEVGATAAGAPRVQSKEVYTDDDEDYGETFMTPYGMAQKVNEKIQVELENEPVLRRAASVFFADIRASATSSDGEGKPHHGKDVSQQPVQNSPEPFPMALPLWEFELSSKNPDIDKAVPDLLDLNVPLAPVMDYAVVDDNFREFALQDYPCENHDPLWQFSQVPQAADTVQTDYPQDACLLGSLTAPPLVSSSATQVQNHFENVFLYTRIPGEDDQDLEFGNFWDGGKPNMVPPASSAVSEHSKLQGACTPDCDTLVSSISNLSKVLLGHYRIKSSSSSLNQTNIKSLQSAILDLSKCLVKAHVQTSPTGTEQVDDKNTFFPVDDDNSVFNDTEAEEEPEKVPLAEASPDDSHEQLMARFRILLGLSGKQPYESSTGHSVVEDSMEAISTNKPEHTPLPFLDSKQVEQRLALLKSRLNWSDDEEESHEGAATMNEKHILVEDDYVAKRGCSSHEPEAPSHAGSATSTVTVGNVGTSIMMTDSGLDKLSDIEESSWEHI